MVSVRKPPAAGSGRVEPMRVGLRGLRPSDRAAIRRWMADPDLVRFTVVVPTPDCAPAVPYAAPAADRYLEALMRDPTRRAFAIELDGTHVGNVGLKDIRYGQKSAECFVEIGEAWARGVGVASAAMRRVLEYAFGPSGLSEVTLGVFEFNGAAIALYERLGFEEAGHYGWHWAEGRYWEIRRMRLSAARWRRFATSFEDVR